MSPRHSSSPDVGVCPSGSRCSLQSACVKHQLVTERVGARLPGRSCSRAYGAALLLPLVIAKKWKDSAGIRVWLWAVKWGVAPTQSDGIKANIAWKVIQDKEGATVGRTMAILSSVLGLLQH